jgi:DNA-binding NtrC family response regulator
MGQKSADSLDCWISGYLTERPSKEEHAVHIKGVKLILYTILRPLHNADGKIVGVFGISRDVTDEVIKSLCLEALRRCEGNRRCAARTLGIARDSLYRHMKRFGIGPEDRTND